MTIMKDPERIRRFTRRLAASVAVLIPALSAPVIARPSSPDAATTRTEPAYAGISYDRPKFVPPDGKILLMSGHHKGDISRVPSAWGLTPGGFSAYFSVASTDGLLSDFTHENNNTQNIKWIADTFPDAVLDIGLWMVGFAKGWGNFSENTIHGNYDEVLETFCRFARTVNRPIFLRIGYEFDGPHNMLEPGEYVAAYRYIVDFIRARGVSNIAYVWHSWINYPYKKYHVTNWYPGDDYVDWFGMSVFYWQVVNKQYSRYMDAFVDLAREHKKPVMAPESGPLGGMSKKDHRTWDRWFVPFFNYMIKKNIKAFSYANQDWDEIDQFRSMGWGNTRIQDYPAILERWTNEVRTDRYLKASPGLFEILGYTNMRPPDRPAE